MNRRKINQQTEHKAVKDSGFYNSSQWHKLRQVKLAEQPLCEECLKQGIVTAAQCVHHKIWLTAENIKDPAVALNKDNLASLCLQCHNRIHSRSAHQRYKIDADGEVIDYLEDGTEATVKIYRNGGYK